MESTQVKRKSKSFLVLLLFLQIAVIATTFLNIPFARQIVLFLYLTFIPGLIIVKLLRMNELNRVETILFSVGLSVAFLMLVGLLTNELSFAFGFSQPLSLLPLMIVLNSIIFSGGILVYFRSEDVSIWKSETVEKSPSVLLFLLLPILSIVGATYVNAYGNNLLLLFTIVAISALFVAGVLSKKLLPTKYYPFALIMIAAALLYSSSFISNHIVSFGSDIGSEYYVFLVTQNSSHWGSTLPFITIPTYFRYNAMLSVTILPTIYSSLLNMDSEWMFKILFPLIFSLVPVGLYQVWQAFIGKKYAFIAAFIFMAQVVFYSEMLGLTRQIIAELFFVLLLLVILNNKIKPLNKTVCFMIFGVALVTSHYATAEIFLLFIFSALVISFVLKNPRKNISVPMVVFFSVIMFFWYIYTSGSAAFNGLLATGNYIYSELGSFFDPASRGQTILIGLGLQAAPSVWDTISRVFAYLTEALIAVGFVALVLKRTRIRAKSEFSSFALTAMALLVGLVLVPGLANILNATRFYHILLFFLAPICVLGAVTIIKLLLKQERKIAVSILLLVVLIPYFLFQTGFISEVTKSSSWSVPLSSYRMDGYTKYYLNGYIDDSSVSAVKWMREKIDVQNTQIYADATARLNDLVSYRAVYESHVFSLSNITIVPINGTVYLTTLNTVNNLVIAAPGLIVTDYYVTTLDSLHFLGHMDMIYSNGNDEIFRNNGG